ncbi:MAG: MBL fold metallo-hydrolase [Candidatus ainarchaeum sp.]|nr:MBL fold metallo-hydrolase [Candidatus ainarchaeum sp.]
MNILQIMVNGFDKNFTYLIIGKNNCGFLIDPTGDLKTIENEIKKNNVNITYQLVTHAHPDHNELVDYFKEKGVKLVTFNELKNNPEFEICEIKIKTIFTPGHTKDSRCYLIENNLFSGDTLFTSGVGTTAYGGDDKDLEDSLNLLETLDKKIMLWPGHLYGKEKRELGEALMRVHKKPSEEMLNEIKRKVIEYEKFIKTKKN